MDKIPTQAIESFFKVNLDSHPPTPPLFLTHGVDDFLGNDDIINNTPPFNET